MSKMRMEILSRHIKAAVILNIVFFLIASNSHGLTYKQYEIPADSLEWNYKSANTAYTGNDTVSTLDDYLKIASLNNPGLRAQFYKWKSSLKRAGYIAKPSDPQLIFAYFIENVETRVGPQEQKWGVRQKLFWPGTFKTKKRATLYTAEAEYEKLISEELQLHYEVKKIYNELWLLGRRIQLVSDNYELLKFWESIARANYRHNQNSYQDLISIQVELVKMGDELRSSKDLKSPLFTRLKTALNLKDKPILQFPDSVSPYNHHIDLDSAINLALRNNSDLNALESKIASKQEYVTLAGKSWFPSITLGIDYIVTGEADNPDLTGSGKDPWGVSAGINIPVWIGKNSAKIGEARAKLKSAEYEKADLENKIIEKIEMNLYGLNDSRQRINIYESELVSRANQALEVTFASYKAGESGIFDLLESQRRLLELQFTLDKTKYNGANYQAQLELLIGEKITD
jgi:outer membrane protein TolC